MHVSANHRDNALAASCRLMMAGAPASVVPRDALLQAMLQNMPFQVVVVVVVMMMMMMMRMMTSPRSNSQQHFTGRRVRKRDCRRRHLLAVCSSS